MSQELLKYLPHIPDLNKKKDHTKKIYKVDKEVLNLTGGLFPVKLIDPNLDIFKKQNLGPVDKWVRIPIIQSNKKIAPIYNWCRETQKNKNFIGEKFNVGVQILFFQKQEYQAISNNLQWTYEETVYLFDLLKIYNLNFIVTHDRYEYQGRIRTIQQIKEQYYEINNKLLTKRGNLDHPLSNYKYDRQYETNRKFELQKYLLRNKQKNEQEKFIIEEIKRLELVIRKEEREQISLKKALKLEEVVDDQGETDFTDLIDKNTMDKNQRLVFTRQQYLLKPLPLPPKLNLKLNEVMQGLNIPEKIVANKSNQALYDELRKKILLMFSAQRYLKKKELQKKTLQEKKKKMNIKEDPEGEKKKYPGSTGDNLVKKKTIPPK